MSAQPHSALTQTDILVDEPNTPEWLASLQVLRSAKVMLVDDEPIMIEVVQAFLEDAGYAHFITTEDPTLALDMLRNQRPDVLLLDLIMPVKSGFELLREIRSEPSLRYMPVIVLTAASDSNTKLQALELGATDFLSKPVDSSELVLRLRNALAFKAYQDQLAYNDTLTGLPNRQLFLERLTWTLQLAQRNNKQCALLQIGLDRFKQINDTLGHEIGDEALKAVSRRLTKTLREKKGTTPIGDRDDSVSLSRLTGDEFIVLLSEVDQINDASAIARHLLDAMHLPLMLGGHEIFINISMGIAFYPQDGAHGTDLLANVGQALAMAKSNGRNTYAYYSPESNARSIELITLETALRKAINNDELEVYYQPKIEIATGRIAGAEALVRWNHADLGPISPVRFIPLAEETGLILPLGEMVLRRACAEAVKWQKAGHDLAISVNVSSLQFRNGNMPSLIKSALQTSGLQPENLVIELTESLLMENAEANIKMLHTIRALGVRLSMDDFGTGYSSLSYLKQFPLHEIKIDRSFIRGLPDDLGDAAIAGAVISMAHDLGLTITAEGVETTAQMDFLNLRGCNQFQGFLFSPAVNQQNFSALLAQKTSPPNY